MPSTVGVCHDEAPPPVFFRDQSTRHAAIGMLFWQEESISLSHLHVRDGLLQFTRSWDMQHITDNIDIIDIIDITLDIIVSSSATLER